MAAPGGPRVPVSARSAQVSTPGVVSTARGPPPCRDRLACSRADCYYWHPPGQRAVVPRRPAPPCREAARCRRADCTFTHPPERSSPPSPADSSSASPTPRLAAVVPLHNACRNGLECTRLGCHFAHPQGFVAPSKQAAAPSASLRGPITASTATAPRPLHNACRYGAACTLRACYFNHPPRDERSQPKPVAVCMFGAKCKNAACTRRHPEAARGKQRGRAANWEAEEPSKSSPPRPSAPQQVLLHASLRELQQLTVLPLRVHDKLIREQEQELARRDLEEEIAAPRAGSEDDGSDSGSVASAVSDSSVRSSGSMRSEADVSPDEEGEAERAASKEVLHAKLTELQQQRQEFSDAIERIFAQLTPAERSSPAPPVLLRVRGLVQREVKRLQAALPIYAVRSELLSSIHQHAASILQAMTGSGKSTQLVQYLIDQPYAQHGQIVCTQPRKLTARTVATRVAEEYGCKLGETIGCARVGGADHVGDSTRVVFTTDSALLKACVEDPLLERYSVIVMDEVHERRIDSDLLLGMVRAAMRRNHSLKLVLMSATLDAQLLQRYFGEEFPASLTCVAGRTFPIIHVYEAVDVADYIGAAVQRALAIHREGRKGDILIFLAGQDEIDAACKQLAKAQAAAGTRMQPLQVLPLHGKVSEEESKLVFLPTPAGHRKVIVSSNVAETGVTIPGLRFVIDSGMVKEVRYDDVKRIQSLQLTTITQSSAKQRAGRAGRTAPGTCYRLYTEESYELMSVAPRAEILTLQPSQAVLQLKELGLADLSRFDWLERPSMDALKGAVHTLQLLQALDDSEKLTQIGRHMCHLPTSPEASATLLAAAKSNYLPLAVLMVSLAAMGGQIWWRGKDPKEQARSAHSRAQFAAKTGDHFSLLNAFDEWLKHGESTVWAKSRFVNGKALRQARDAAKEIVRSLQSCKLWPAGQSTDYLIRAQALAPLLASSGVQEQLGRALAMGYFQHLLLGIGRVSAGFSIVSSDLQARMGQTSVWQSDPLANAPTFAVYHELLNISGRNLLSLVTQVQPAWLEAVSPHWRKSFAIEQLQQDASVMQTFPNLGSALLTAVMGPRGRNLRALEERVKGAIEISFEDSALLCWTKDRHAEAAKKLLAALLAEERAKLLSEVHEVSVAGTTRILLGPGARVRTLLLGRECTTVVVRKLPPQVQEAELRPLVERFGRVDSVWLHAPADGAAWAKVRFADPADAGTCVRQLNMQLLRGSALSVTPMQRQEAHAQAQDARVRLVWHLTASKGEGKLFFRDQASLQAGLPQLRACLPASVTVTVTPQMLPTDVRVRCHWVVAPHKGAAIAIFSSAGARDAACMVKQGSILEGQAIQCKDAKQAGKKAGEFGLFIGNLAASATEEDVTAHFRSCEGLSHCFLMVDAGAAKMAVAASTARVQLNACCAALRSLYPERTFVQPLASCGRANATLELGSIAEAEALVAQLNGRTGVLGIGKFTCTLLKPAAAHASASSSSSKRPAKPLRNGVKHEVKLTGLPLEWDEQDCMRALNGVLGVDGCTIFRQPLGKHQLHELSNEEQQEQLIMLQSLFTANSDVAPPEIQIQPPSHDGRCVAVAAFESAADVLAMLASVSSRPTVFGCQGRLMPLLAQHILIHREQRKAIPRTLERIKAEVEAKFAGVRIKEVEQAGGYASKLFLQGDDQAQTGQPHAHAAERTMRSAEAHLFSLLFLPCSCRRSAPDRGSEGILFRLPRRPSGVPDLPSRRGASEARSEQLRRVRALEQEGGVAQGVRRGRGHRASRARAGRLPARQPHADRSRAPGLAPSAAGRGSAAGRLVQAERMRAGAHPPRAAASRAEGGRGEGGPARGRSAGAAGRAAPGGLRRCAKLPHLLL